MKIATLSLALAGLVAVGSFSAMALAQVRSEPAAAAANALNTVKEGDADGAFVQNGKFAEPTGAAMYKRVCAGCHMPNGEGAKGAGFYPALTKNEKLAAGAYPAFVILKGMNGMPPIGRSMTDQQIADVVNYVRTSFGNKYRDKVTAADVAAMH